MALNLYLFRHGETTLNLDTTIIGGQMNYVDLSKRGIKQAKCLGQRLMEEGIIFDEIYSSTAKRAIKTAEIACKILGYSKKIPAIEELLELSQGDWEEKKVSEIYTPEIIEKMKRLSWNFRAPNGESQREVEQRAYNWIEKNIIRREKNLNIGIFGHGLTTKCLIRRIIDSDPRITYRMVIDNCSISQFKYAYTGKHQGWSLVKINDNYHLRHCGFKSNEKI